MDGEDKETQNTEGTLL